MEPIITGKIFSIINYLKQLFLSLERVQPDLSTRGIESCEKFLNEMNINNLNDLINIVRIAGLYFPERNINFHINFQKEIVDQITTLLIISKKYINLSESDSDSIKLLIIEEYISFSLLLSQHGLPGEAYNYLTKAINCGPYIEGTTNVSWDMPFWERVIYKLVGARENLVMLSAQFFYLSRILAHNYDDSFLIFDLTKKWVHLDGNSTLEDIYYIAFYSGVLAAKNNKSDMEWVRQKLIEQYEIQKNQNAHFAFIVAESLAYKYGEIIGEDTVLWAKRALTLNIDIPKESETTLKLNVLLNDEKFNEADIFNCLKEYLKYLNIYSIDKIDNANNRQRKSDIIIRIIINAIEYKKYTFAVKCALLWRTYFNEGELNNQIYEDIIILLLPTLKEGKSVYLIMDNDTTDYLEFGENISIRDLIDIKNKFEGTWTVLANDLNPIDNSGGIFPDERISDEYDTVIDNYFHPEKIGEKLLLHDQKKNIRLLELTWTNTPLLPKISKQLNRNISSFVNSNYANEVPIKKVLIWSDPDLSLTDAVNEQEALEKLLVSNNVDYEVYYGEQCTKDLFLSKYNDDEFDLIWLICHGSFDFDNPNNSGLKISKTEFISIDQLEFIRPFKNKRRLILLNACQSGNSAIRYDGMGFVGLGPSLSNYNQSVIGHLWSVYSFAASVFGALFLSYCLKGNSWGDSLNRARIDMSNGKSAVLYTLGQSINERIQLLDSIEARSVELDKLIYWASPILFE